jgi:hypothetical protein
MDETINKFLLLLNNECIIRRNINNNMNNIYKKWLYKDLSTDNIRDVCFQTKEQKFLCSFCKSNIDEFIVHKNKIINEENRYKFIDKLFDECIECIERLQKHNLTSGDIKCIKNEIIELCKVMKY